MSTATSNLQVVNADLLRERQSATIDSEEFAQWWAGGKESLHRRRALEQLFFDDPEFDDCVHESNMSHVERYEHNLVKATKFVTKLRKWHATQKTNSAIESMYDFRMLLSGPLGTGLFQQSLPLRLHFAMFLPTLLGQGTEEQQKEWLPQAWNVDIVGTYAQTELGHGTFVRGLETRADYDPEREEFVLNSPTLTAYKWWPGGLGNTANVAIVMAQLFIKGQHCGLHPFLVRIRDAKTHLPEPGVDVGDIGAKLAANGLNNGFLGLRDVRIPRKQMLMKNAQVQAGGKFIKGPTPLLTYGTMVFVRVMIIQDMSFGLSHAATIATRYSAVRRQSPMEPDQPEPQILDRLTQQAKLFPQIARALVYRIAADYMWSCYKGVLKELDAGNQRNLPELHALSCCLKAVCTDDGSAGIETLRKSCGGHGYLASANLSVIYGNATGACTYEGENTVLLLQTARFLMKNYLDGLKRVVLPTSLSYLRNQTRLQWSSDEMVASAVRALEIAASEQIRFAFEQQRKKRQEDAGRTEAAAANLTGLKLIKAARMHGHAFLARIGMEQVAQLGQHLSPALTQVLQQLLEMFVLGLFLENLAIILRSNALTPTQIAEVEQRYEFGLSGFRCNAIAVVDGFDLHDRVLGSTLGCYDGRAYERIMEEARKNPLNQEPVNRTFHTHLKPLLNAKL